MSTLTVKERSLLDHVIDELSWDPKVNPHEIAVSAEGNIITLEGNVHSYFQKMAAERAALRVQGVKGVANDIEVKPVFSPPTDTEIAKAIQDALDANAAVPADAITVIVRDGRVALQGAVHWHFQREAARKTAVNVKGVRQVVSNITVKPGPATSKEVRKKIVAALHRNADIEAAGISVTTVGHEVVLKGHARSWAERNAIESAAWAAPGVTEVRNELTFG